MNRLTLEERRRAFLARQDASRQMLAQASQPISVTQSSALPSWLRQVAGTAMIAALVGGSWIAWHAVALRVPSSAVEALLPRL